MLSGLHRSKRRTSGRLHLACSHDPSRQTPGWRRRCCRWSSEINRNLTGRVATSGLYQDLSFLRISFYLLVVTVTGPSIEALEAPRHERPNISQTGQRGAFLSVGEPSNHQNATLGEALEGKSTALDDEVNKSNSPQSHLGFSSPWRSCI